MSYTPHFLLHRRNTAQFEPVTLAEAKLFLRIDHSDDDLMLSDMIVAARMAAEMYLSRSLVEQGWHVEYLNVTTDTLQLPMPPALRIDQISAKLNASADIAVLDSADYALHGNLLTHQAGCVHTLSIDYVAGAPDLTQLPDDIRRGILEHLGVWYDRPERNIPMPASSLRLYHPHKKVRI